MMDGEVPLLLGMTLLLLVLVLTMGRVTAPELMFALVLLLGVIEGVVLLLMLVLVLVFGLGPSSACCCC